MRKDPKFSRKIYKHSSGLSVYQISSGKNFPCAADLYYNNTPSNFIRMLFLISSSYRFASGTGSKEYIKSPTMDTEHSESNSIFNWENRKAQHRHKRKAINNRFSWVSMQSLKKKIFIANFLKTEKHLLQDVKNLFGHDSSVITSWAGSLP